MVLDLSLAYFCNDFMKISKIDMNCRELQLDFDVLVEFGAHQWILHGILLKICVLGEPSSTLEGSDPEDRF